MEYQFSSSDYRYVEKYDSSWQAALRFGNLVNLRSLEISGPIYGSQMSLKVVDMPLSLEKLKLKESKIEFLVENDEIDRLIDLKEVHLENYKWSWKSRVQVPDKPGTFVEEVVPDPFGLIEKLVKATRNITKLKLINCKLRITVHEFEAIGKSYHSDSYDVWGDYNNDRYYSTRKIYKNLDITHAIQLIGN